MSSYIVKRLLLLVPVLLGVSLVVFAVMALVPGIRRSPSSVPMRPRSALPSCARS